MKPKIILFKLVPMNLQYPYNFATRFLNTNYNYNEKSIKV
jgi:hypothetical protein